MSNIKNFRVHGKSLIGSSLQLYFQLLDIFGFDDISEDVSILNCGRG